VLKLMELSPARTFTLDEARDRIEAILREEENDKTLKELLKKWREEMKAVTYDDNLKKVRLPQRPEEQLKEIKGKKGKQAAS
jgi:hypothetical protein